MAGADTGFPVGGAPTLGGGRQHINLPDFPQKLHEIKKILVRRWGAARRGRHPLPLGSATAWRSIPRGQLEMEGGLCIEKTISENNTK